MEYVLIYTHPVIVVWVLVSHRVYPSEVASQFLGLSVSVLLPLQTGSTPCFTSEGWLSQYYLCRAVFRAVFEIPSLKPLYTRSTPKNINNSDHFCRLFFLSPLLSSLHTQHIRAPYTLDVFWRDGRVGCGTDDAVLTAYRLLKLFLSPRSRKQTPLYIPSAGSHVTPERQSCYINAIWKADRSYVHVYINEIKIQNGHQSFPRGEGRVSKDAR